MMETMIWAIVLAAGESRRMGRSKPLLPFRELTFIEVLLCSVLESRVDQTVIVLGADRMRIRKSIAHLPVQVAVNSSFRLGMLSSVCAGLKHIGTDTGAAIVTLADQPHISPVVFDRLIETYERSGKGIVVPVVNRRRGHPLLVDLKYRKDIIGLAGGIGLRELFQRFPHDVAEAKFESADILLDVDTPEDYRALLVRDANGRQ